MPTDDGARSSSQYPLADLRVLEAASGIAGPYCGKLFIDAGAQVVKVEPPTGDPLRSWSPSGTTAHPAPLFAYLNAGKQSVVGSLSSTHAVELLDGADLLIVDEQVPDEVLQQAIAAHPSLVVCSITPFGRNGDLLHRPWSDLIVQAESGALGWRGLPERHPVQLGGRLGEWLAGCHMAPAALAATLTAQQTGRGEFIDCSMVDVVAVAGTNFTNIMTELLGNPEPTGPARQWSDIPSVEPAADGWVGLNTNAGHHFELLCVLIERPELVGSPWHNLAVRMARRPEWEEMLHAWTRRHTVAEIVERGAALRIPVAPVHSGRTVLENPHLVERQVFARHPDGFLQPRRPYLLDGERLAPVGHTPELGAGSTLSWAKRTPRQQKTASAGLPLDGMRVLDLTNWWVGAAATHVLAGLGAEVIHIESTAHPDGMRTIGFHFGAERWWERSYMFLGANTNKLGLTLDLNHPEGLALLERLVKRSDAVVENFSPRVLEQFGITWDKIHSINPRAVFMRMPAFGLTGPWRERVAFAQTMEQMSGIAWVTGYRHDAPMIGKGVGDPIAGMHGAFALLVALAERERTGRGVFVEATMIEAILNVAAEAAIEWSAHGLELQRDGNRSPHAAPQGVYRCREAEQWLAVSVVSDDQWQRLTRTLERPDLASDPTLTTLSGRHAAHDRLDEILEAWAAAHDVDEAVRVLIGAGVPAARLADPRFLHQHALLQQRRLYDPVEHPVVGPVHVPGLPYRWKSVQRWTRLRSPLLGEHNHAVLGELLGVSDDDLDKLEAAGVIGTQARSA
jgi:crotonobetainyl-CoA:carnitine CoA-transferase CaiB-like acyl-CoA transferase